MIRLWHILIFVLALGAFGIARAPAAMLSRLAPFSYASAEGTVWDARFLQAEISGLSAGELTAKTSFWELLGGRLNTKLSANGPGISGRGALLANLEGDRRIVLESAIVEGAPLGNGVILPGRTEIDGLDLFFDNGACTQAQGVIRSDILSRNGAALRWNGPELVGGAQCWGEAGQITLSGNKDEDSFTAVVTLQGDGAGQWRAVVISGRPEVLAGLATVGFEPEDGSMALRKDFRWFPF
jgi:hypothetical protein